MHLSQTVRSQAENLQRPIRSAAQIKWQHDGREVSGQAVGWHCQTIQGQFPRASIRSKVILSLKVSIACQKP